MTVEWLHPSFVLIVGAWVLPLLKGTVKRIAMVLLPAIACSAPHQRVSELLDVIGRAP